MINGVRFKVCGITSQTDAALADGCGADFIGFIFYPKSPRFVSIESYRSMHSHLPLKPKVAVTVEPTSEEVSMLKAQGFDYYQFHFPHNTPLATIESWSRAVTPEKLWLAPKLPPGSTTETAWHALAGTILLDTFKAGAYGGTGETGDWGAFARYRKDYPRINWVLAGGLSPDNIVSALKESHARFVDVNSGVESVPGIKSAEKLGKFAEALHSYKGAITKAPF